MAIGEVDVYPRLERLSDSERPEFATFFSRSSPAIPSSGTTAPLGFISSTTTRTRRW